MWKRLPWMAASALILLSATAPALEAPTFNDEVVRILQARCQTCHRPGEHAPFSLLTYRDAYARRDDMRDAVRDHVMPPWKPVPGFGKFAGSRRLSDAEVTTNWQDTYTFTRPIPLPAGTRIDMVAVFDTSSASRWTASTSGGGRGEVSLHLVAC